jgi:hypothetical protein
MNHFTVVCLAVLPISGEALHPVLDHKIDPATKSGYESSVATIMNMSDPEVLAFIPDKPFAAYSKCPKCYGGVQGNHTFKWEIARPDEMKCRYCGTVFPNEDYPEEQSLTGNNGLGEKVTYKYFRNEERGESHFLSANLCRWRRNWLMAQCEALGKTYQVTKDEKYARRAVLLLDRLAQVYPHYPVIQNLPWVFKFCESQKAPWRWDSGRWGYFHNELPRSAINTYDLVYHSEEFDQLSKQREYDVRKKLINDFFVPTFDALAAQPNHIYNVVGYDVASAALLGRVINRPRYVHWAFDWMKRNVNASFFYDGLYKEAPSYHYMTLGGLRFAFDCVRGYSDPPDYKDAVDGTRFDNLQPEKELPFWARVQHAPEVLDFPNGCSTPVHDTHPYERRSKPRNETVSTIAPGFGHASLGRGKGPHQMQAQLHFSGSHGHSHFDNLNLTLWAKEREMIPDIGYTWTKMRYWPTSSVGHNLVVIDRTDQKNGITDGDLLWFFPNTGGLAVVEADGIRNYGNIGGMLMYRRLLITIPVSETDAYVVDLFRVAGGSMHDWALHGDADKETTATCTLPLSGNRLNMLEPGEKWEDPVIHGRRFHAYGMLRNMQRAETDAGFEVNFKYNSPSKKGIRIHMPPAGKSEVWLGRSPTVRGMGQGGDADMRKAYEHWMPQLLVRRTKEKDKAALESRFVAVHEPYDGSLFLQKIEVVDLSPADDHAFAIRVHHGESIDTIFFDLNSGKMTDRKTEDGLRSRGRLTVLRERNGQATSGWLFEGESLQAGDWQMNAAKSQFKGEIDDAHRKADGHSDDSFITDATLPAGKALHGVWMIVTHGNGFTHGYEIDRVRKEKGKTVVVLTDEHGLRIKGDETEEVYYPLRKIKGKNTFVIPLSSSIVQQ